MEEFERHVLGIVKEKDLSAEDVHDPEWDDLQARVEQTMDEDELSLRFPQQSPEEEDLEIQRAAGEENEAEDDDQDRDEDEDEEQGDEDHASEDVDDAAKEGEEGEEDRETETEATELEEDEYFLQSEARVQDAVKEAKAAAQPDADGYVKSEAEPPSNATGHESDPLMAEQDQDDEPEYLPTGDDGDEAEPDEMVCETKVSSSGADTDFLESLVDESAEGKDDREILAMTLTVVNKINGRSVLRPEKLDPKDRWTIEYQISEVTSQPRAWNLYEACQMRRKKKLQSTKEDDSAYDTDKPLSPYVLKLRELSEKGRQWRTEMEEQDRELPREELGKP